MNSPVRGLDRLAQELRQERHRASQLQQERNRWKIEAEKRQAEVHDQQLALENKTSALSRLEEERDALQSSLEEVSAQVEEWEEEAGRARSEAEELTREKEEREEYLQELQEECERLQAAETNASQTISRLENTVTSRNDVIEEMERELKRLRNTSSQQELRISELSFELSEKSSRDEDLQLRLEKAEVVEENYRGMQESSEHLRSELDEVMQRSAELSSKLRESEHRVRTLESSEMALKEDLQSTKARCEKLRTELSSTDEVNAELSKRMDAESENAAAAQERAESALRQKEQLEQQLQRLRDTHEASLKRCEELEETESHLNSRLLTLQSQLSQCQDECHRLGTSLQEAEGRQGLAQEVETLRSQLSEVRRKLAKREIEEDVDRVTPSALLEREKNTRSVYEKLTADLRGQVDRLSEELGESKRRLSEAQLKLLRVEELEEQIQIYKESSVKYSQESLSAVESAQEERERNDRASHEMRKLISDLKSSENELHLLKSELLRVRDDFDSERVKLRQMHLEKLAAERRASEAVAAASRESSEREELKFRAETAELELQRAKRSVCELERLVQELRGKRAEADKQRTALMQRVSELSSSRRESSGEESAKSVRERLELQLQGLRQEKSTLEMEHSALQKSLQRVKSAHAEQSIAMESLRGELADLKQEREFFRRDVSSSESSRAEKLLQELRKDLASTTTEWRKSEEDRQQRVASEREAHERLEREHEKSALLVAQVRLLEEKLRVTSQELAVFRGLDVYQKSMTAGLAAQRGARREALKSSVAASPRAELGSRSYLSYDSDSELERASKRPQDHLDQREEDGQGRRGGHDEDDNSPLRGHYNYNGQHDDDDDGQGGFNGQGGHYKGRDDGQGGRYKGRDDGQGGFNGQGGHDEGDVGPALHLADIDQDSEKSVSPSSRSTGLSLRIQVNESEESNQSRRKLKSNDDAPSSSRYNSHHRGNNSNHGISYQASRRSGSNQKLSSSSSSSSRSGLYQRPSKADFERAKRLLNK